MIKQIVRHWTPAAFCAFIVFLYQRKSDRVSASIYITAIPFCFYFVALVTYSMQKQIGELQAEVKELRRVAAGVRHDV